MNEIGFGASCSGSGGVLSCLTLSIVAVLAMVVVGVNWC
jgi:hypothetical protein